MIRQAHLAPIAAVLALGVISAGCIVQDRPEEANFFVVADAGPDQIVIAGETAHFDWPRALAIEAEGSTTPQVELAYAWWVVDRSPVPGTASNYSYTSVDPNFALITLNVTGEGVTAADATGVLFVPGDADASHKIYLAVRGDLQIGGNLPGLREFSDGNSRAQWLQSPLDLPAAPYASIPLTAEFSLAGSPEGSMIVAVKDGAGPARGAASQMLELDSGTQYTLLVDTSPAAVHRILTSQGGAQTGNVTLDEFKAAHAVSEHEQKVLVTHAQTLAGFEGAAAAATFGLAALVAARRRRA
jgi:hypothetical protein